MSEPLHVLVYRVPDFATKYASGDFVVKSQGLPRDWMKRPTAKQASRTFSALMGVGFVKVPGGYHYMIEHGNGNTRPPHVMRGEWIYVSFMTAAEAAAQMKLLEAVHWTADSENSFDVGMDWIASLPNKN